MNLRSLGQWTAILICGLAAAALAVSQAFVIHDHVAMIHGHVATPPPWPDWAQWTMAAGFELAIVAVGLAVAVVGWRGWLTVAELFLVGVSVVAGGLVTYPGPVPPLVETASMAMVPLQYVAVILAAHTLYGHYAASGQTTMDVATATPTIQTTASSVATATSLATPPRPRPNRAARPATDPRVAAAIAAGVPRTTARRWAALGDQRLDEYKPQAKAA